MTMNSATRRPLRMYVRHVVMPEGLGVFRTFWVADPLSGKLWPREWRPLVVRLRFATADGRRGWAPGIPQVCVYVTWYLWGALCSGLSDLQVCIYEPVSLF